MIRRHSIALAALFGTLLMLVPLQSQAFFGFFGGGFSFGTGWSGWGGPGWWGPRYWGAPGYGWHRPFYGYRPWLWTRHYRPHRWAYLAYATPLPYLRPPALATTPTTPTPQEPKEK